MSPRFLSMNETIEKIQNYLQPLLVDTDMFIVDIKIKPINNIKVFIDADSGFSIEKCVVVNRRLYSEIEAEQLFPNGDFSLEVSSPGIDEPLLQWRQYKKNVGRKVAVTDLEDKEEIGMLTAVTEEDITIEIKKAKEKDPSILTIPFSKIKKTIVQIIF